MERISLVLGPATSLRELAFTRGRPLALRHFLG